MNVGFVIFPLGSSDLMVMVQRSLRCHFLIFG